jgi:hypothetical protein
MNELKTMCMRMELLVFLDSVLFQPCAVRKLPEAFGLSTSKFWYPHYFYKKENLDYIGRLRDVKYYGDDAMSQAEIWDIL